MGEAGKTKFQIDLRRYLRETLASLQREGGFSISKGPA